MGTQRVNLSFDAELLKTIDNHAKRLGMNRSEFVRLASEEKCSRSAADEGMEIMTKVLRRVIADELSGSVNRLAKMIAKDTKASATTMYLLTAIAGDLNLDGVSLYQKAEKAGVNYLTTRDS